MQNYLQGKTALITGISKGIGRAVTEALLQEGVNVVGWGRTAPAYQHENLRFMKTDVTSEDSVQKAFAQTFGEADQVDFLVNNAGFGHFSPIEDFSLEKFQGMMDVNVLGPFLVTRAIVPRMKKQGSGHILNISSIAGRVGMPQGGGYNSSKFALTGFSESLFQELRKSGIKVTAVYPGSTATGFFDEIPGAQANEFMVQPSELADSLLHVMNTSPNYLIREIEIRPLNSKAVK